MAESNKNLYFVVLLALLTALATLFAIIAGLYALPKVIDSHIDKAINNTEFIRKIASHVRPYMIIDSKGSVLVDDGAMQYLQRPPLIKHDAEDENRYNIVLTPKNFLAHPPLIEMMRPFVGYTKSERGSGLDWHYESYIGISVGEEIEPEPVPKFRIEIIR